MNKKFFIILCNTNLISQLAIIKLLHISVFCKLYANSILTTKRGGKNNF